MICKIYLPFNDIMDSNFEIEDNYYSNNSYEQALQNSLLNDKLEADLTAKKEDKMNYTSCECKVLTERLEEATIDTLCNYAVSNEMNIVIIQFDFDTMEEDFETELKLWIDSHKKIQGNSTLSEDDKILNEPKRDLKVSFPNLKGIETFLDFHNCKLLESVENNGYAMLVESINFGYKI